MAIEEVTIKKAKEIDDVLKFVVELVEDIRAGKEVSEIAAENLPGLMDAINGIDQVDDEYKENLKVCITTASSRVGELVAVLLKL